MEDQYRVVVKYFPPSGEMVLIKSSSYDKEDIDKLFEFYKDNCNKETLYISFQGRSEGYINNEFLVLGYNILKNSIVSFEQWYTKES